MARSIHTTRRDFAAARRAEYRDEADRSEELNRILRALSAKQSLKGRTRQQRRTVEFTGAASPEIPVRVQDVGPEIHYPATPEDLRAVLRRLPPGSVDGLGSIDLCLGAEAQGPVEEWWLRDLAPDPYTGPASLTCLPGVYCGRVLGQYAPERARIRLMAYVYAEDLPDRGMWEVYLKLQMLSTFMHELAHHHDWTVRRTRPRWAGAPKQKREEYAEGCEQEWTWRYVLPYVEAAYPEGVRALRDWLQYHGGTALPLAMLVNLPAAWTPGCPVPAVASIYSVGRAVEILAEDVLGGEERGAARVTFARELHYGEHYAHALEALASVLAEQPEHLEALTLRADIYVHQERLDEAEVLAERVIAADAGHLDAWEVLADIYEARRDAPQLLAVAEHLLPLCETGKRRWFWAMWHRAKAHHWLGRIPEFEAALELLTRDGGPAGERGRTASHPTASSI
jgi:tetratricopeptide (TPR) repeat protein